MFKFLNRFRVTATDIMQDQLFEAEREVANHEAAAEHHEALAMMYRSRVERLNAQLEGRPVRPSVSEIVAGLYRSTARVLPKAEAAAPMN